MNAPDKVTEIKAFLTGILAIGSAIWGMTGWAIIALICCIILDYLSGTWAAMAAGEWSSSVARQGLWHKLGEIVAITVAIFADIAVKVILNTEGLAGIIPVTYPNVFTLLVSIWYIFTELGSIIENASKLGAPVPKFLTRFIAALKKQTEDAIPGTDEDITE